MTISPQIVKGWTEEVVNQMKEVHGDDNINMDLFSYHFRMWKEGKIYAYVRKNSGFVYRPCVQKNRNGAHKMGRRAGVLFDLSNDEERKDCLEKVKDCGRIYDPWIPKDQDTGKVYNAHKYCQLGVES